MMGVVWTRSLLSPPSLVAACWTVLLVLVSDYTEAWGDLGHRIVGGLAQRNVSESTAARLQAVLPADGTLASVADWADHVKYEHEWIWTRPLHYADTDAWTCSFRTGLDCPHGQQCVVGAIANYTRRLRDPPGGQHHNNRTVDLMLLVHFVGDLVQPLHVGFKQDKGGNEIHGQFCGHHTNLHAVWDELVLERRLHHDFHGSEHDYVEYLLGRHHAAVTDYHDPSCRPDEPIPDCLQRWASDSASLACRYAYADVKGDRIVSGFEICDGYYDQAVPIIETQLVMGGIRLAWLLDQTLAADMQPSFTVQFQ